MKIRVIQFLLFFIPIFLTFRYLYEFILFKVTSENEVFSLTLVSDDRVRQGGLQNVEFRWEQSGMD